MYGCEQVISPEDSQQQWGSPQHCAEQPPLIGLHSDELGVGGPGDVFTGVVQLVRYVVQHGYPAHGRVLLLGKTCNKRYSGIYRLAQSDAVHTLCESPHFQTRSCGSRPAWRGHRTTWAPSCSDWAEQKTAAGFSRAAGTGHLPLLSGKELLQPAGIHNTLSWSAKKTNRDLWVAFYYYYYLKSERTFYCQRFSECVDFRQTYFTRLML